MSVPGRRRFPACLLAAVLAGCAASEATDADVAAFGKDLETRAGAPGFDSQLDPMDGALPAEARVLLEGGLTEDEAVKIAFVNNRRVRASYEGLGIPRAELLRAGLLSNPVFSANAKFFDDATEIELELVQSFVDLFYRPLRQSVAAAALAEREAQVKRVVVEIAFDVRRAFVGVRAARDVEELYRHVLVAAEGSWSLMKELHDAGNVTDQQFTAEEVALGRAKMEYADAIGEVRVARETLNMLLGLWGTDVEWRIDGRLDERIGEEIVHDGIENHAVAQSLALAEAKAHAETAARAAGLISWERFLVDGEIGVAAKQESEAGWGLGPALRVPLPLFDGGQARIAAAESGLREALHDYTASAVETRAAARVFRERLLSLAERAKYVRHMQLPLASRLVKETLQNYNAMQIGAFEVLNARQEEIETAREYVETLRDAQLARLDLAELLAGNLNRARLDADTRRAGSRRPDPTNGGHR